MSELETTVTPEAQPAPAPKSAGRTKSDRRKRRRRAVLIAIIVILLLSLCAISAVLIRIVQPERDAIAQGEEAGGVEWVRSIYGWGPAKNQTFVRPLKVDVTSAGQILVTDQAYEFVMEFNPDGTLAGTIGESPNRELYRIGTIEDGQDGQLFVGQTAQDRVLIFNAQGSIESSLTFPSPNDIEFSGDRVAISSNVGFVVFDAQGNYLYEVGGEKGSGPDQFDVIAGIDYGPDGTLYVCDSYNNRISAFDDEGNRLWTTVTGDPSKGVDITEPAMAVGRETTAPARLQMPVDITNDGNGRVVVVDGMDFSMAVFDAETGEFVKKYGEYGAKEGQLLYPTSIDYDAERDWFVVSDGGNRRVQILRIEDSAAGGGAVTSAVRRALSGPLRALLFPLLILLALIVVWVLLRKRKRSQQAAEAAAAAGTGVIGSDHADGGGVAPATDGAATTENVETIE